MKGEKEKDCLKTSTNNLPHPRYIKLCLNISTTNMISYNNIKFNEIGKEIKEILLNNNIDVTDAEESIDEHIIELLTQHVNKYLEPASSFTSVDCPKCGNAHLESMQTSYTRKIIFKIENLLIKLNITVPRLKCKNCGSTHAVLPDFCVPFKQYSKPAIVEIASEASAKNTQTVANSLDIDEKQVRRFVNVVNNSKDKILLISNIYPDKFKEKIDNTSKLYNIISAIPIDFNEIYFNEFRSIFLYEKNKRKIYMQYHKLSI